MTVAAVAVLGAVVAWALTVPLHRCKELRPLGRRDIGNEDGVLVRAVWRHARVAGSTVEVGALDVVPVLSWFVAGPRTRHRAPATVVVTQLAVPATMALTAVRFESIWLIVAYCWFCVAAVAIAVTDARILLIPWWMPWVTALGALLLVPAAVALGETERILWALAGGAGAFAVFFVLFVAAPGRLGYSDVRLALPIGLYTGFVSPLLVLWALLLGSLLGVLVGVWSMVRGGERHFAFGPALAAGALLAPG
ncbi:MAG: hypothetical protein R2716_03070 [Microthrixaceae bacterium]